jgi:hypothetical protein
LVLTSCGGDEFGEAWVSQLVNEGVKQVDAEQVTLNQVQIDCGVKEDLWTLESRGTDRSVARLLPSARNIGFADDIQIGELRLPYTMVHGKFTLRVEKVVNIHDQDPATKIAEVRVGVVINHSCFPDALPMMGVHKGQFDLDTPARVQFASNGGWTYDRILH